MKAGGDLRLKFTSTVPLKYGANAAAEFDDPDWPRFIRITDITSRGALREDTFRSLPPEIAAGYELEVGDILLARSGATVGKAFIYDACWGAACYAGYLIRSRTSARFCPKFIYWYLQSAPYWGEIQSNLIQATIQNFSAEKYANLRLPVFSLAIQERIASFLDEKTARIDALVAKKQALLEQLGEKRQATITRAVTKGLHPRAPMRDSGVDWLGTIPAHLGVRALRFAVENLNRMRVPIAAELRKGIERLYPYYGASGIIDYVDDYIFDFPTVLVAEDGANLLSRSTPLAFCASG